MKQDIPKLLFCNKGAFVPAFIFSSSTIIGQIFHQRGTWDYLYQSPIDGLLFIIQLIGLTLLFFFVINLLIYILENRICSKKTEPPHLLGRLLKLASTYPFIVAFFLMLAAWLPFWIIFFPGNLTHDASIQLYSWEGWIERNNQQPFASTIFFGTLYSIGERIGGVNCGIAFITGTQMFVSLVVFSIVCKKIDSFGISRKLYWISVLFYAAVPIISSYAITVVKDAIYCAVFVLFVLGVINLINKRGQNLEKGLLVQVALPALFVCLFRNDGIYIVVPVMLALIIMIAGKKKLKILFTTFLLIACFVFIKTTIEGIGMVKPVGPSEMLSIPFQQTARYVKEYSDDVTFEEREIIQRAMHVEDIYVLASLYDPNISDPVKGFGRSVPNLSGYIRVWWEMGLRHPDVYIKSMLNGTYGYYYPFAIVQGGYLAYIDQNTRIANTLEQEQRILPYYVNSDGLRQTVLTYMELWRSAPIVSLLSTPGFYTCVLFLIIYMTLRKRKFAESIVFLAPTLVFVICILSPVNGDIRYELPIIESIPILVTFCICQYQNGQINTLDNDNV